ncbi:MAG: nicotinate-nucleotide adenylyltransferase, partial [Pseudomonadota bacterium]
MTVGLLGGSFNPAHDGHREISLQALRRMQLDQVWWLVSPQNPLKSADDLADYDARVAKARAVADHPRIRVSDFERRRKLQYTYDTLRALIARHGGVRFVWLMGADNLQTFHKWAQWRAIAGLVPIAVFARPGYELSAPLSKAAQVFSYARVDERQSNMFGLRQPPAWIYLPETRNPLSSTQIRAGGSA